MRLPRLDECAHFVTHFCIVFMCLYYLLLLFDLLLLLIFVDVYCLFLFFITRTSDKPSD